MLKKCMDAWVVVPNNGYLIFNKVLPPVPLILLGMDERFRLDLGGHNRMMSGDHFHFLEW